MVLPLLLTLATFGVLLVGAWMVCPQGRCITPPIDHAGITLAIENKRPWLDAAMLAITWAGSIWLLAPLALMHAVREFNSSHRMRSLQVPLTLFGATVMAQAFKWSIDRPRPVDVPLIDLPFDPSYPSAHAMQVTAFMVAFLIASGRMRQFLPWLLAAMLVGLVGLSRIYLQVHFATDVLLGTLAALVWAIAVHHFIAAWELKK